MDKLLELDELFWWLPPAQRIFHWGVAMGWLWGRFPFMLASVILATGGMLVWSTGLVTSPLFYNGGVGLVVIPLAIYGVSLLWGLAGAIGGAMAGFYAPANEEGSPFDSPFFRLVSLRAFWCWLYLEAISVPIIVCAAGYVRGVPLLLLASGLSAAWLVLSVRYGTSVALRKVNRFSLD
jgi:hypothetical protein